MTEKIDYGHTIIVMFFASTVVQFVCKGYSLVVAVLAAGATCAFGLVVHDLLGPTIARWLKWDERFDKTTV